MNIVEKIRFLYGLKKVLTILKEVDMFNWKTTLFGIFAALPQIWQVVMPNLSLAPPLMNAVSAVMAAIAFYYAKDKNVTGGTTKQ